MSDSGTAVSDSGSAVRDASALSDASIKQEAGAPDASLPAAPDTDACAYAYIDPCPELGRVRLYDTGGFSDESQWIEVSDPSYQFSSVRNVVIESDLARVTYEYLNDIMEASHSLYLRSGENWKRLTGSAYGDYTYWGTSVTEPASSIEILQLSRSLIAAKFRIVHTINNVVYDNLQVTIEKTVAIHRCYPGMFVGFHTDPTNINGEREVGFGAATEIGVSKQTLALHPLAGTHVNLGLEQTSAPYWALGMHGENDSLLRYLVVNRPIEVESYQFSPGQWGLVTVHFVNEQSLVPERFQAFIGGIDYPAEGLFELEDTPGVQSIATDTNASNGAYVELSAEESSAREITVPMSGTYSMWLRHRNPEPVVVQLAAEDLDNPIIASSQELAPAAEFSASTLGEPIWLDAGTHIIELTDLDGKLDADALFVTPFGGNPLFPEELGSQIAPILAGETTHSTSVP